jgi:hypothetical protein
MRIHLKSLTTAALAAAVAGVLAGPAHAAAPESIVQFRSGVDAAAQRAAERAATSWRTNAAGTALLRRVVERPGPVAGAAVSLAALGLAVEVFAWTERHPDAAAAKALTRTGPPREQVGLELAPFAPGGHR